MAGQQYDQGSELYYMRARYYDPQLGRFLSEDPIGISGGLNLFAYAGNDPINKIDPTGTSEQCGWAWFEYTYRYIEGPKKGEISRIEYGQEWVCDNVADSPASAPSAHPAKGNQKPWQEEAQTSGGGDPIPTMVPPNPALKGCPAVATFTSQTVKSLDPLVTVTAVWQMQRRGEIRDFFKMKIPGVPYLPGIATGYYQGTYVDPLHPPVSAEGVVVCDAGAGFFW